MLLGCSWFTFDGGSTFLIPGQYPALGMRCCRFQRVSVQRARERIVNGVARIKRYSFCFTRIESNRIEACSFACSKPTIRQTTFRGVYIRSPRLARTAQSLSRGLHDETNGLRSRLLVDAVGVHETQFGPTPGAMFRPVPARAPLPSTAPSRQVLHQDDGCPSQTMHHQGMTHSLRADRALATLC